MKLKKLHPPPLKKHSLEPKVGIEVHTKKVKVPPPLEGLRIAVPLERKKGVI